MKNISYLKLLFVFISVLIASSLLFSLSCTTDSSYHRGDPLTVRWSDPDGYNTNVVEVAQEETPFTLVFPGYIPEEIYEGPIISGLSKNDWDDSVPVNISYRGYSHKSIDIEETNMPKYGLPLNEDAEHFFYFDTEVVEFDTVEMDVSENGTIMFVPCYSYYWIKVDIGFSVSIYKFSHEEARKVIQSMIE